jgi:hypothetical protein
MRIICNKKEKSTLSWFQNCGYAMLKTFMNSDSIKRLSNFVINMLTTTEHWVFICAMNAKKTSLHTSLLTPIVTLKMWAQYEWLTMWNVRYFAPMLKLITQSWVTVAKLLSTLQKNVHIGN